MSTDVVVFLTLGFQACCQAGDLIGSVEPILVVEPGIRDRVGWVKKGSDLFFSLLRDMDMLDATYCHCILHIAPVGMAPHMVR